jgi:hypothetical protein
MRTSTRSLSRTSAASLPAPASSSSPLPMARDGKGTMAMLYFVTVLRLARHGGRRPLEYCI